MLKTLRYILILFISSCPIALFAAVGLTSNDSIVNVSTKSIVRPSRTIGGSLMFDLAGCTMAGLSAWGQYEFAARASIKECYFPVLEIGLGVCNHTSDATDLSFKTKSPYFRVGLDYNFLKNKSSGNKLLGGVRYGFSNFRFDLAGPPILDPISDNVTEFSFKDLHSRTHWGEIVLGVETKIYKFIHLGWSFRYKFIFNQKSPAIGKAWYSPGYGRNNGNTLGGTLNLIFNI